MTKKQTKKNSKKNINTKTLSNVIIALIVVAFIGVASIYVVNKIKGNNKPQAEELPSNLSLYNDNGILFNYPKDSVISKDENTIKIDNWEIDFFAKPSKNFTFSNWFENNFDKTNCQIMNLVNDNKNMSYSMQYVFGVDCKDSGIYLIGNKKIGKLLLGNTPNNSYEQVLSSLEF